MEKDKIEYFKINETFSYQFYQMPKELFKNPYYKKNLSLEGKVAYTLLLDRLKLSIINKWFNENNEIFLIYTRQELIDELEISKSTASKIFRELVNCNLIKEERLGQGSPNRIYIAKIQFEEIENYKKRNFRSLKTELLEVQNSISRSLKEYANNKDINNTNNNNLIEDKFFLEEKVSLYGKELENLVSKYGIDKVCKFVIELNTYKLNSLKEYSSDYDAILRWVVNKVEKEEVKNNNREKKLKYKSYSQREYEDLECYYDNL